MDDSPNRHTDIFDRNVRRRARDRAFAGRGGHDFLHRHAEAELLARVELAGDDASGPELRIGLFTPPPPSAIALDPGFAAAHAARGIQADEDRLPIADASMGRIVAAMSLHGVNDLPGALILCRRALKPGGRLFAVFPGGYSLAAVREAFLAADAASGRGVAPRLGPTVDPAEAAGLLQRAGLVEPVVDIETVTIRYRRLADLARDVRGMGDSGWLATRQRGLTTPARWAAAEANFAAMAGADGKVPVEMQLLYLTARAHPGKNQRRG